MNVLVLYGGVDDIEDGFGISVHGLDMAVQIDNDNPQRDALKNLKVMIGRHCPICP